MRFSRVLAALLSFEDAIVPTMGFPLRTMSLVGTWDVTKLKMQ